MKNPYVWIARTTRSGTKFTNVKTGKVTTVTHAAGASPPVPPSPYRRRRISRASAEAEIRRIMEGQR